MLILLTENSAPPAPPAGDKVPITLSSTPLPLHYNIRTFRSSFKTLPITLGDIAYHSVGYWVGQTLGAMSLASVRIVGDEQWGTGGLTQDDLDLMTQDELDLLTQFQIEDSSNVGVQAPWGYAPGLNIDVPTTGINMFSRFDSDNLIQAPFDIGTHYIELVFRDFPAQAATPHINLATSVITFSSDPFLAPAATDIIPLEDSLLDLSAGGDVTFRIDRDSLVNVDLSNIRRINLYMEAVGGTVTLKAEAMRLVPASYSYHSYGIDTKSGWLTKNPSINGTDITSQTSPGPIMNTGQNKLKNLSHVVKFNSGHLPTAPDTNEFNVYYRADTTLGGYIEVAIQLYSASTEINVYEGGTHIDGISIDALTENTDYFLETILTDDTIVVKLWKAIGSLATELIAETDPFTVGILDPGWIAYDFSPFYSDFYIDYMYVKESSLAELESVVFPSITPVRGVTLYPDAAPAIELFDDESSFEEGPAINLLAINYDESGKDTIGSTIVAGINDVVVDVDTIITNDSPSSIRIQKQLRNAFIGGIEYSTPIRIDNLSHAVFTGDIYFDAKLNFGSFRIVLFDRYKENVAYSAIIPNLVPGKWNSFNIPVVSNNIYNNHFILQVHHIGIDSAASAVSNTDIGTFWIDNFKLVVSSVTWEASNDGGLTYVNFFDTIGSRYQGVNFPALDNQLKIRAKAHTSNAWIAGYQAVVHYAQPGRIIE